MNIPLTQGKIAVVDEIDADLANLKWCAGKDRKTFYAVRGRGSTRRKLHRVIAARMGIRGIVDHKNRDGLDCRRSNLRAATPAQSIYNRGRLVNNTSGFIGVYWYRQSQWRAQIGHKKQLEHIGYFPGTEQGRVAAARAYNKRALELHGDRAVLNVITEKP
jgi:hypothetical protein